MTPGPGRGGPVRAEEGSPVRRRSLGLAARAPLDEVLRPLWPYLAVLVAMLMVVTYWPWLTLIGPRILLR